MEDSANASIDGLIRKLRTKAGRAIATVKAFEKGLQVSDAYRLEARNYFTSIGDYDTALNLCKDDSERNEPLTKYNSTKKRLFEIERSFRFGSPDFFQYFGIDIFEAAQFVSQYLGIDIFEAIGINVVDVAQDQTDIAKKVESGERTRLEINKVKSVINLIMSGLDYNSAYNIVIRQNFNELSDEAHKKGIKVLEKLGEFGKCAKLDYAKGNLKMGQAYETLDNMLKTA